MSKKAETKLLSDDPHSTPNHRVALCCNRVECYHKTVLKSDIPSLCESQLGPDYLTATGKIESSGGDIDVHIYYARSRLKMAGGCYGSTSLFSEEVDSLSDWEVAEQGRGLICVIPRDCIVVADRQLTCNEYMRFIFHLQKYTMGGCYSVMDVHDVTLDPEDDFTIDEIKSDGYFSKVQFDHAFKDAEQYLATDN